MIICRKITNFGLKRLTIEITIKKHITMNMRKLKSWFPDLSYRQKVTSLVISGVIVGLGGLFFYLLRMHTYIVGDDPAACVNCHIMAPYYATWAHSSHGRDATCNDCHVPHSSIAAKYLFKGMDLSLIHI